MEKIGEGAFGEVFVQDGYIYKKVFNKNAFGFLCRCKELLDELNNYYPVGKMYSVEVIDDYLLVKKDYVEGITLDSAFYLDMSKAFFLLEKMARLQFEINSVKVNLSNKYSDKIRKCIEKVHPKNEVVLLEELGTIEEEYLCHGDFHPQNVIVSPNGDLMAIDWDNASMGNPLMDVCRTYLLFSAHEQYVADAYLDLYLSIANVSKDMVLKYRKFIAVEFLTESSNCKNKELLYKYIYGEE